MTSSAEHFPYVLITPARNEAAYIERTIQSVIKQTVTPLKWVIVDDGSLDDTVAIVSKYVPAHSWIELVELPKHKDRSFAGKVYAFNVGLEKVAALHYKVIGNLDADVSFDDDYMAFLMTRFQQDADLGVAGPFSMKKDTVPRPTALKGGTTCPDRSSCSAANASSRSAAISRTRREGSTGWP